MGHVDVSVFLADPGPATRDRVGRALRRLPAVRHVYYESRAQAYAEFQRLYTCSAAVPPTALSASYRLLLRPVTRPERDAVVRAAYRVDGVARVSCDPSSPCVDIRPPAR